MAACPLLAAALSGHFDRARGYPLLKVSGPRLSVICEVRLGRSFEPIDQPTGKPSARNCVQIPPPRNCWDSCRGRTASPPDGPSGRIEGGSAIADRFRIVLISGSAGNLGQICWPHRTTYRFPCYVVTIPC